MGAYVQGAPPPRPRIFHNNDFGSSGNYGSGRSDTSFRSYNNNDFGSSSNNDFDRSFGSINFDDEPPKSDEEPKLDSETEEPKEKTS